MQTKCKILKERAFFPEEAEKRLGSASGLDRRPGLPVVHLRIFTPFSPI